MKKKLAVVLVTTTFVLGSASPVLAKGGHRRSGNCKGLVSVALCHNRIDHNKVLNRVLSDNDVLSDISF